MTKEILEKKIKETEDKMNQASLQLNDLTKQIFIMEGMLRSYRDLRESSTTTAAPSNITTSGKPSTTSSCSTPYFCYNRCWTR